MCIYIRIYIYTYLYTHIYIRIYPYLPVQSACSALLHGEMFTFGGRGAGMIGCCICPDTVVTYGGTKTVCNPILILNTSQNGVNCVQTPY